MPENVEPPEGWAHCYRPTCGRVTTVPSGGPHDALAALQAREQKLVEILSRLTDPDPCSYDHHGACRAHNLHKRPCPHGAAKDLLRELRPEDTDA